VVDDIIVKIRDIDDNNNAMTVNKAELNNVVIFLHIETCPNILLRVRTDTHHKFSGTRYRFLLATHLAIMPLVVF
jgi:hypothetical protein